MKKAATLFGLVAVLGSVHASAATGDGSATDSETTAALLQTDTLSLDEQEIQSSGAGFAANGEDWSLTGVVTQHRFNHALALDFPQTYQSVDVMLDVKDGRYQYLGAIKQDVDQASSDRISAYQFGAALGYQTVHEERLSVVLGGGLVMGDLEMGSPVGDSWKAMVVPLLRVNYTGEQIESKFEFLTSPNLSFTLFPNERVRLSGDFRMEKMRDERDLLFELSVQYRLFDAESPLGDFAGISLGVKNDQVGEFAVGPQDDGETLEIHYRSLFATLDLSILKVTIGYAFDGRALYREDNEHDIGDGAFFSLQGVVPL